MKNVTIALDDETHRRARIKAAEMGTSLSALVKEYLTNLGSDGAYPLPSTASATGVRDVQMPFHHDAPAPLAAAGPAKGPDGQPYFVNGKWVWTKDGKPRKPGALRGKLWIADDFDEWPDGFIDAMYGEDTEAANNWWKPFANPPKKPGHE
jgi:plasmid stability protein